MSYLPPRPLSDLPKAIEILEQQRAWNPATGEFDCPPCGCRIGECESKPSALCRMTVEIATGEDL